MLRAAGIAKGASMYRPSAIDALAAAHRTAPSADIGLPGLHRNPAMKRPVTLADLRNHPAAGPLLLLAFAFAVRAIWFGDPVIQVDEQFYLLTGDRLLHGALPFVDIWDRKPIGLFLLYAGIRLLGGTGIVEYQVVGTLFAWGTAMIISRVARSVASRPAAWLAGAVYLLWIN